MSILQLNAIEAITTKTPIVQSHDFKTIWSYAIATLAILVVVYAVSATPEVSHVDLASLSMSP